MKKGVQVLVATMNQNDHSLIDKMKITSDAIIGNQCDRNEIEQFMYNGKRVVYLSFAERGVGLNRNNTLMRADTEYCIFADDDMFYLDGYEERIISAFENNPKADVIVFNLKENIPTRYVITKTHQVRFWNFGRYGAARIAIRLESIRNNAIYFNQCYGGGTEHCHGEDNLFLCDCLKAGLKIYAIPDILACLTDERQSTWNNGYGEKYLHDQGDLYKAISKRLWKLLCLQDVFRHKKTYGIPFRLAYKTMIGKK